MVDVLVDVDDDDPVGGASALFPALVVVLGGRLHERTAGDLELSEHHPAIRPQQLRDRSVDPCR